METGHPVSMDLPHLPGLSSGPYLPSYSGKCHGGATSGITQASAPQHDPKHLGSPRKRRGYTAVFGPSVSSEEPACLRKRSSETRERNSEVIEYDAPPRGAASVTPGSEMTSGGSAVTFRVTEVDSETVSGPSYLGQKVW